MNNFFFLIHPLIVSFALIIFVVVIWFRLWMNVAPIKRLNYNVMVFCRFYYCVTVVIMIVVRISKNDCLIVHLESEIVSKSNDSITVSMIHVNCSSYILIGSKIYAFFVRSIKWRKKKLFTFSRPIFFYREFLCVCVCFNVEHFVSRPIRKSILRFGPWFHCCLCLSFFFLSNRKYSFQTAHFRFGWWPKSVKSN